MSALVNLDTVDRIEDHNFTVEEFTFDNGFTVDEEDEDDVLVPLWDWESYCENYDYEDEEIPCCQLCHDGGVWEIGNCPICKTGIYANADLAERALDMYEFETFENRSYAIA